MPPNLWYQLQRGQSGIEEDYAPPHQANRGKLPVNNGEKTRAKLRYFEYPEKTRHTPLSQEQRGIYFLLLLKFSERQHRNHK